MNAAGLWMLLVLGLLTVSTGLPVWALLIGVASAFAGIGLATGTADAGVLSALPARLLGLLEHDLLQAMPLYAFIGVLLQRLPLADALFAAFSRAGAPLATLAVGALVAPMNGSVASSSALLARLAGPRVQAMPAAPATALISAAATIGVVVPPSLVLILLGDAMLRAHTEASNLPGFALQGRIINTQDVMHAALLPALAVLLLWAGVAWWQGRAPRGPAQSHRLRQPRPARRDLALAAGTVAAILALLGGVFTGKLLAVEGAATGGCLLAAGALATRALPWAAWRQVLADTLALSGALFALLAGATTFSLVFRVFGTDAWLSSVLLAGGLPPQGAAALILGGVVLCAWVLDAFEMIFVIIPIVAPVLVLRLADAQQAAVLLLLVLQLSFLLPPMGYAVLMARSHAAQAGRAAPLPAVLRALAPYLLVQLLVASAVFFMPQLVHGLDGTSGADTSQPLSRDELTRQMEEMSRQPGDEPASPSDETSAPPPLPQPARRPP